MRLERDERFARACRELIEAWDGWGEQRVEPEQALQVFQDSISVIRDEIEVTITNDEGQGTGYGGNGRRQWRDAS